MKSVISRNTSLRGADEGGGGRSSRSRFILSRSLFSSCSIWGKLRGCQSKGRYRHLGRYTNRSAMRSHSLSLRQRVRFAVPNLCLNPSSRVAQGSLRENHNDSSRRACSQLIPDLIASESGHLTQNHIVGSSGFPRIYGSQLSSSVAGIRSGLVNTPVKSHRSLFFKKDTRQHTDCSLTSRIILPGKPMCPLIDEVRCIYLIRRSL